MLQKLQKQTEGDVSKKQLEFAIRSLRKPSTQKGNVLNDCLIYCEACLIKHCLLVTNDHKFKRLMSDKVWEVFTQLVKAKLEVEPVPLVLAEEIIVGM